MGVNYLSLDLQLLILLGAASINTPPRGFVGERSKIISFKEVELADDDAPKGTPTIDAEIYAGYPLIILSQDGKKEIARMTPDESIASHYSPALIFSM